MDRSLKWRTLGLVGIILFCVGTLAPSFAPKGSLPSWFGKIFAKKINLGLDLQGGLHIVYSIALDKAVDDKASEIRRDLESRFVDEKIAAQVKTPGFGAVTVILPDAAKKAELAKQLASDYGDQIAVVDCAPAAGANALCAQVTATFAERTKTDALRNAVSTIRERIDEKGIAEPSVIEKGDQIIVELPGVDKEVTGATKDVIARAAKLEFKVVDDGAAYMSKLYFQVAGDSTHPADPAATAVEIKGDVDLWTPEKGGAQRKDPFLIAYDRKEEVTLAEARKIEGCYQRGVEPHDGKVTCTRSGRSLIEAYVAALATRDASFKIPDDHELGYELNEASAGMTDKRPYWRTYYLDRAVRLTGSAIQNASVSYDPNTNRPVVLVDFNRYGGRIFGDLTAQVVGRKIATILDGKVKSAPVINDAIRGGRASITMGGGNDPQLQEREANDLVAVLKTGSLPASLQVDSESEVGPSLGRDAIDKTKLSFGIGILLVIVIMVGIYRWSGVIAVVAVLFHIITTLAVMALFGATLTLPGIAAIVLSIGMEVDGNILIYERIRDELLLGKSVRGAVDVGFSRAFTAILDGQLTTAASGWVLLQYGSGPIKGFAVMLLVGVFTTLTTNIWVSRIFFDWYIAKKKGQLSTISI
jgi:preprotein translocase subunit SecD